MYTKEEVTVLTNLNDIFEKGTSKENKVFSGRRNISFQGTLYSIMEKPTLFSKINPQTSVSLLSLSAPFQYVFSLLVALSLSSLQ